MEPGDRDGRGCPEPRAEDRLPTSTAQQEPDSGERDGRIVGTTLRELDHDPLLPSALSSLESEREGFLGLGASGGAGLDKIRERLRSTFDHLSASFGAFVENTATLEVRTFVSQDLDTLPQGADPFENAHLRAITRIELNGNAQVCVPIDAGEVDQAIWDIHASMVTQAQNNRVIVLKAIAEALGGLVSLAR